MTLALTAKTRKELGKKVKEVRKEGFVPAVVYGKKQQAVSLQVPAIELVKVFAEAGESTLVDLSVDGKAPVKVLIHDFQVDPVTRRPLHVDFHAVDMTQEIEAEIDLTFTGESKAVKALGGIFVKNQDTITVKCLPSKLFHELEIDISPLDTFDDKITVADIKVPEGVVIVDKPEMILAFVEEPRSEEELKQLDEKIETKVEEVEVEEKGKPKEEGAEEGGETATEPGAKEQKKEAKKA